MCRRISCSKCGKPSWAGCGAHVEQVLGNVPRSERCQCRETKGAENRDAQAPAGQRSWISRLILGG
jgi:hypothetical protein